MKDSFSDAVLNAESRIAEILRDLEKQTGTTVHAVNVENVESLCPEEKPKYQRMVLIEMQRKAGSNWVQAKGGE